MLEGDFNSAAEFGTEIKQSGTLLSLKTSVRSVQDLRLTIALVPQFFDDTVQENHLAPHIN